MAQYTQLHDWTMTPHEAVELQKSLRERVRLQPLAKKIRTVAGEHVCTAVSTIVERGA